jgi:glycosyltransferase involved in cell wall biosynthesis
MRILVAHCSYRSRGGEDQYVRDQLELLRPHHDVTLFEQRNEDLPEGLGTAARMGWSPGVVRAAERYIGSSAPQVVHLHNAYPGYGPAVHLAAEKLSIPLVMTVHNQRLRCPNGVMFTDGGVCRRCENGNYLNAPLHRCHTSRRQSVVYATSLWFHRFVMRLEKRVAMFIAPSGFMARRLASWGIRSDRIVVVRNFTWPSPNPSSQVGLFGLYVGRLSAEKGVDDLLEALAIAGDPPFRIVGGGPLEGAIRAQATRLGLRRSEIVGRLPPSDVRQMLREARFVVVPSRCEENAPLAAVEALSEGRPLVVPNAGGLPELVEASGGRVYAPGDVHDLAQTIRCLIDDGELCRTLGHGALQYYRQALDPTAHRNALEAAYRSALAGAHRDPTY